MIALDQITADLSWRETELASLKILLQKRDLSPMQHQVLLRAAWTMLYAHYEGFVKTALTIFFDEASKKAHSCAVLPPDTRANALLATIKKIRILPAVELLDEVENFCVRYHGNRPTFNDVDTKSNLWPNILADLLKSANISSDIVDKHKFKISTLVHRRNNIAHGRQELISEVKYYIEYETAVYDMMYELAFLIDDRLSRSPYQ